MLELTFTGVSAVSAELRPWRVRSLCQVSDVDRQQLARLERLERQLPGSLSIVPAPSPPGASPPCPLRSFHLPVPSPISAPAASA